MPTTKNLTKFGFQKYAAIKLHGNLKNEIKQSIVYLFICLFISVHEKLNQFK